MKPRLCFDCWEMGARRVLLAARMKNARKVFFLSGQKKNDSTIKQTQHALHEIFISRLNVDPHCVLAFELHQWCLRGPINLNKKLFHCRRFTYSLCELNREICSLSYVYVESISYHAIKKFFLFRIIYQPVDHLFVQNRKEQIANISRGFEVFSNFITFVLPSMRNLFQAHSSPRRVSNLNWLDTHSQRNGSTCCLFNKIR